VKSETRRNALRRWLESLDGVESVEISPVTGSVLIHYRVGATDGDRLVAAMRDRGWLATASNSSRRRPAAVNPKQRSIEKALAQVVIRQVAEIALERGIVALCAALL
jgi:hypothetical protein